jgi:hypothetical protein
VRGTVIATPDDGQQLGCRPCLPTCQLTTSFHEGSIDGPVIGTYHHDGSDGLSGPEYGDIIGVDGAPGRWRVTAGQPSRRHREAVIPEGKGKLAVERVE